MLRFSLAILASMTLPLHSEQAPRAFRQPERVSTECANYLSDFVHSIGKVNPFREHEHDYDQPVNGDIMANKDHAATLIDKHCQRQD